jgi:hypothetical protein
MRPPKVQRPWQSRPRAMAGTPPPSHAHIPGLSLPPPTGQQRCRLRVYRCQEELWAVRSAQVLQMSHLLTAPTPLK